MTILIMWLFIGGILLGFMLTDKTLLEWNVLNSTFERFVFVWAWPAFLMVMILSRFCREDGTDPDGVL